jgi:hypothetical protein
MLCVHTHFCPLVGAFVSVCVANKIYDSVMHGPVFFLLFKCHLEGCLGSGVYNYD